MKIIRKGEIPTPVEEKFYECTCTKCNTLFEFQGKEATNIGNNFSINCPLCEEMCWIQHTFPKISTGAWPHISVPYYPRPNETWYGQTGQLEVK